MKESFFVRQKFYDIRPLLKSRLLRFFMVLLVGLWGGGTHAQTIRIKLVNGKNGHPMGHKCVNVGVDHVNDMLVIPTDKEGVASLRLTDKDTEINTQDHWSACGGYGVISPVVKYSNVIDINVGFVICLPHVSDYSWLKTAAFSKKKILESGIVMPNACGKAKASPEPGEVIIFVRPLTWWEKFKS
jgi:hypothetical protein